VQIEASLADNKSHYHSFSATELYGTDTRRAKPDASGRSKSIVQASWRDPNRAEQALGAPVEDNCHL
jgi:hypothetical protein